MLWFYQYLSSTTHRTSAIYIYILVAPCFKLDNCQMSLLLCMGLPLQGKGKVILLYLAILSSPYAAFKSSVSVCFMNYVQFIRLRATLLIYQFENCPDFFKNLV